MVTAVRFSEAPPLGEDAVLSAGNIQVDVARYQALVGGSPVPVTYQEFELLRLLVSKPDRILPYDEVIQRLWREGSGTRRRLGVVVCRLRAKLAASAPYHIQTVRGRGYGLTTNVQGPSGQE